MNLLMYCIQKINNNDDDEHLPKKKYTLLNIN